MSPQPSVFLLISRFLPHYRQTVNSAIILPLGIMSIALFFTGCGGLASGSKSTSLTNGITALTFSPLSLSFGSIKTGTGGQVLPVTVQNTGSATLQISQMTINGAQNGNFTETSNCGSSLSAGNRCTVSVKFNPIQTGQQSATLQVTDNASGSPQAVALSGIGTSSGGNPGVTFNPTSLNFGNVQIGNGGRTLPVVMENIGDATLQISQITINGAQYANFSQSNNCGSSLQAGSACKISVTFNPTQIGQQSATLQVSDNAPGSPQTMPLSGGGSGGNPVISAIKLSPSQAAISAGSFQQFTASCTDQFGHTISCGTLIWSSDDTLAATVDASGLAAGVYQGGPASITAVAADSVSGSAALTITEIDGSHVSFYVAGDSTSSSYPVTDNSTGGNAENGVYSDLTRGSGSTTLSFSTYLNGTTTSTGNTQQRAIWVDPASGDVFIGGRTTNSNYATAGAFQTNYAGGQDDAVICRFSASGTKKWCSYLGTNGSNPEETVYAIAGLDLNGNLTVCGRINFIADGTNFDGITATRLGTTAESGDQAYIAKVKPDGSALVWFTGFGGTAADGNRGRCVLDSDGNVYGEGDTESTDFPATSGAYQTTNRATNSRQAEGMAYKMSADGTSLVWSTYVGGSGVVDQGDAAEGGLVLDSGNNVYIATNTPGSANFFSTNGGQATGFQKTLPAGDGLGACTISHISADGSTMLHSTFLGGAVGGFSVSGHRMDTECGNIILDSQGNLVVYGYTSYTDWPTSPGAYQTIAVPSSLNGWVAVLSPDLSTMLAGSYVGSSCVPETSCPMLDNSGGIGVDSNGNIYGSFASASAGFPVTVDALYSSFIGQGNDIAVFGLTHDLRTLVYGTYLGGPTLSGYTRVSAGNWPWAMWVSQ